MEKIKLNPVEHLAIRNMFMRLITGKTRITYKGELYRIPSLTTLSICIMRKSILYRGPVNKFETLLLVVFAAELNKRSIKLL